MAEPLISIVIPVYKVEKYLDRCVSTIVNQTYKNIEILLVDDGSPDNCPALCDAWAEKDDRVRVIHKENGGLTSARNTGLRNLSGEYVTFIDSDDWVEPDAIETLYRLLVTNNASISVVDLKAVYSVEEKINNDFPEEVQVLDREQLFRFFSSTNCYMHGKLYDVGLFANLNLPETLSYSEDIAHNYYIAKRCERAVVTNYKYYYYFRHPESIMMECISEAMIVNSLECYKWMERCVEDESETIKALFAYSKVMRDFFMINSIIRNNTCTEYFEMLKNDTVKYEKYILSKNADSLFTKNQIFGYKLLKNFPLLYKQSILIRKKIRGY